MKKPTTGTTHLDYETVTLTSDPLVYARRVLPARLRKTTHALSSAWEDARRIDYWAVRGFLAHEDAADAWAVAGDAAEEIGAVKRMREARRHERVFRTRSQAVISCFELFEGPLLPWPEIERWTGRDDLRKIQASSTYGRIAGAQRARMEVLGFPSFEVGPGERAIIAVSPEVPFRPQRLIFSIAASHFMIEDIRIGITSMMSGPVPAIALAEIEVDVDMLWPTVNVGERIQIEARNISSETQIFQASLMGTVVEAVPIAHDWSVPIRQDDEILYRDGFIVTQPGGTWRSR